MVPPRKPLSERTRRRRLRRQGLRPIEIRVPDTRAPGFIEQAHRQSLAVASSPHEKDDQDFVDSISDFTDE
jgi:hypothetical protein